MINVIIADDHKIVVDGLISILDKEEDIKVIGTAKNGGEVLDLLKETTIDIAILDIEMPGMSGVQLCEIIHKEFPLVKVLILSMYKSEEFVRQIMESGAKGYILKNKGSDELVKAIRYIYKGHSFVGQEITEVLINAFKKKVVDNKNPIAVLTKREKEVLKLIAKGLSSIEIGKTLFIAPTTVDTHRRNIREKLDIDNSKELIIFALENKLM